MVGLIKGPRGSNVVLKLQPTGVVPESSSALYSSAASNASYTSGYQSGSFTPTGSFIGRMVAIAPPSFPVRTAEREGEAARTYPRDVTLMRRGMPGAKVENREIPASVGIGIVFEQDPSTG